MIIDFTKFIILKMSAYFFSNKTKTINHCQRLINMHFARFIAYKYVPPNSLWIGVFFEDPSNYYILHYLDKILPPSTQSKKVKKCSHQAHFLFLSRKRNRSYVFLRGRLSERYKSMIPRHTFESKKKANTPPSSLPKIGVIILGFPK